MSGKHVVLVLIVMTLVPLAAAQAMIGPMERLAHQSLSDDAKLRGDAVQRLREMGPPALAMLMDMQASARRAAEESATSSDADHQAKLQRAIDQVAAQKDGWVSGLFWYTDMQQAQQAAQAGGKPILSLRLLGRLDDELSCANSRFFRTALYANQDIAAYLRENYVLHWQSVRPVPVITIDYGDGRKIERTITGNSIHYVLDSHGRIIDALPGLYAPQVFLANLQQWDPQRISEVNRASDPQFRAIATSYHRDALNALRRNWDGQRATIERFRKEGRELDPKQVREEAVKAQMLSVGKRAMEMPMIEALMPQIAKLNEETDEAMWRDLAALYAEQAKLDDSSIMLMRTKHPTAQEAGRRTMTKIRVEDPILKIARSFEQSIAMDTVINEYQLRPQLRQWITQLQAHDLDALNARVYAELFLTPGDDPWLGLGSDDAYTALPARGIVNSK